MKFMFVSMNDEYAIEIAHRWHYEGVYSFYDMEADEEDLEILMDEQYWPTTHRAVLNEDGELVGWASFYIENDDFWLSLGLRPDLTGRGLGGEFVAACLQYAALEYPDNSSVIKLAVAEFNGRAIKVYQRAGFIETKRITRDTQIGTIPFLEMEKKLTES